MRRYKWFILAVLLPAILLVGSLTGIALATDGSGDQSQQQTRYEALLDKVIAIYQENTGVAIDRVQLENAFAQARSEMQDEALKSWLQNLVDQGKITQEQADEYMNWWQSRPDTPLPGAFERGFGGHGFHGGMRWDGPYAPPEASDS